MSDVIEGGNPAPEGGEGVLTEQQQIEADAVERFRKSQPGYVDPNPMPEGHNYDVTPITEDDKIPEKYKGKTIEEVIEMHQEAEKKISNPDPKPDPTPKPKEEGTPEPKVDGEPKPEATGFQKFVEEYQTSGAISEDSYTELEAKGFSKGDIDGYIEGQKAIGQKFTESIHGLTGGEEGYTNLINWASENMDEASISEYNDAIMAGDQAKVTRLVEYMALKHGSATPNQPNRINGNGESEGGGLKTFANKGEWMEATNNRLYGKDKKYTEMVDQRYLKSKRKGSL